LVCAATVLSAQDTSAVRQRHDSLTVRFVATDIRAVIQALGRYLSKPVLVGNISAAPVTLETPAPVARSGVQALLKGLVESQNLQFTEDSGFFRIAPASPERPTARPPDRQGQGGGEAVQLFVIRLKHARAADVAATVNLLFGGSGEFAGSRGLSGGTLSEELRRNVVPVQPPADAPTPLAPTGGAAPHPATLSGPVTIVPDQLTNSLLVRASPQDFAVLRQAVEEVDIRPLQVLIEVLIVEVQHNRSFSLGTDFIVPPQPVGARGTAGGQLTSGGLGDLVVQLMNLGHAQVDATLRAAASRGDVHVVSRPVLLASNNTEAQFLVGSQQPFVQVSRSQPTQSPSFDEVVQYRDVGTKLTVRPTINEDGYVSLVIRQEVSQATAVTQFNAPVISTREADTQVLVKDGQTIVLGGLRDHQKTANQGGIPILSSLPIIGGLFGSASRSSTETELYLFLTPRILKTDADADSVTAPRLPKVGAQ